MRHQQCVYIEASLYIRKENLTLHYLNTEMQADGMIHHPYSTGLRWRGVSETSLWTVQMKR